VKENLAKSGFIVHKDDYSVTRSDDLFRKLFVRADLQIVHQAFQEDFPEVKEFNENLKINFENRECSKLISML